MRVDEPSFYIFFLFSFWLIGFFVFIWIFLDLFYCMSRLRVIPGITTSNAGVDVKLRLYITKISSSLILYLRLLTVVNYYYLLKCFKFWGTHITVELSFTHYLQLVEVLFTLLYKTFSFISVSLDCSKSP